MYPSQLERYINEYRKKEDGADRAGGREREKRRGKKHPEGQDQRVAI